MIIVIGVTSLFNAVRVTVISIKLTKNLDKNLKIRVTIQIVDDDFVIRSSF